MFYRHYEDVELRSLSPSNIYYTKILGNQMEKIFGSLPGKRKLNSRALFDRLRS